MKICFDLDETLCTGKPYKDAKPLIETINTLNYLKECGHIIIIYTARGMSRFKGNKEMAEIEYRKITENQLNRWGVIYDNLIFGKPSADIYIDDKGLNVTQLSELSSVMDINEPFTQCCEKIDTIVDKISSVLEETFLEKSDGRK